jgi:WD40 repeat protein
VNRLPRQRRPIWALGFSADGRVLVTEGDDGTIRRWSLPSGRPTGRPFKIPEGAVSMALGPDARTLSINRRGAAVEMFELATGKRLRSLPTEAVDRDWVMFTADGRFLVTRTRQGQLRLWSTDSWKAIAPTFGAGTGDVTAIAVSPDGRTIATGSADGGTRLWDRSTGRLLGSPLPGVPNGPVVVAFTPDSAYVVVVTGAGRAFRWDVRPSSWARRACQIAGRTLTRAEWTAALPGRDYAPACTP